MYTLGEGNGNPLRCSCLENPVDRGDWWAAVHKVAQSRARLKRLSSSRHVYTTMDKTDSYWEQLQSTESSVQHSLLTQMGGTGARLRGKSKREGIYVYI